MTMFCAALASAVLFNRSAARLGRAHWAQVVFGTLGGLILSAPAAEGGGAALGAAAAAIGAGVVAGLSAWAKTPDAT
ncbi:MAG: hypothetical protein AAF192_01260 [Pseudomonadota bacterium]